LGGYANLWQFGGGYPTRNDARLGLSRFQPEMLPDNGVYDRSSLSICFPAGLSKGFDLTFPLTVELRAGTLIVNSADELARCVLYGGSWGKGRVCCHVKPKGSTNYVCWTCSWLVLCCIRLRGTDRVILLKDAGFGPNVVTTAEVMRLLLMVHAVESDSARAEADRKRRVVRPGPGAEHKLCLFCVRWHPLQASLQ
jgi:hypothetical protein